MSRRHDGWPTHRAKSRAARKLRAYLRRPGAMAELQARRAARAQQQAAAKRRAWLASLDADRKAYKLRVTGRAS